MSNDDDTMERRARAGLREVLRERAERHEADVIMQVLTVASGAAAIGVERPCDPEEG